MASGFRLSFTLTVFLVSAACGSRTGLFASESAPPTVDASTTPDAAAPAEASLLDASPSAWQWGGDVTTGAAAARPIVGGDGTVYAVVPDGAETTTLALDPGGHLR